jgi:hypothetical protein
VVLASGDRATYDLTLLDKFRYVSTYSSRLRAAFLLMIVDKVKLCGKIVVRCKT